MPYETDALFQETGNDNAEVGEKDGGQSVIQKRGRGRPPGSKNKPKVAAASNESTPAEKEERPLDGSPDPPTDTPHLVPVVPAGPVVPVKPSEPTELAVPPETEPAGLFTHALHRGR